MAIKIYIFKNEFHIFYIFIFNEVVNCIRVKFFWVRFGHYFEHHIPNDSNVSGLMSAILKAELKKLGITAIKSGEIKLILLFYNK